MTTFRTFILPLNFGMAVNGAISISKAYLDGGASFQDETAPIRGNVRFGENTCRNLVTGKGNTTDKSEFYWFGTEDASGIIPQIDKTLAQIPQNTFAAPKITYKNGNGFVNLTWTEIDNAEKYAVCGYAGGKWKILGEGYGTSFTLDDLKSGTDYKVAVIAKINGEWNMDFSNAVVVSVAKNVYPKVTAVEYSEEFHQFRMKWTSVPNAEQYGIAVKLAGKWKVQAYTDAKTTVFTSPKLKAGSKYDIVVCSKVNGK